MSSKDVSIAASNLTFYRELDALKTKSENDITPPQGPKA
jgi:hypothetical protein